MNNKTDFRKKSSGIVLNINSNDHKRAKKRNAVQKEQDRLFGADGKIAHLEKEVSEIKNILKELLRRF